MTELYSLHTVSLSAPDQPLFAALALAIPGLSRRQAREAISAGLVKLAGQLVLEPKHPLGIAAVSAICDLRHGIKKLRQAQLRGGAAIAERPFTILYEDAHLVVVNKAVGVLSAPTQSGDHGHVPELLRQFWRKQERSVRYLGVVHRLDLDTSGCLCFALSHEAQRLIAVQFASHSATRSYRCLVMGSPRQDSGTIHGKIGRGRDGRRRVVDDDDPGKEAVSHYTVVKRLRRGCEMEVRLETGRTHQIRVHMLSLGCPVYGDRVYARGAEAPGRRGEAPPPRPPRLMLHAHTLALDHPLTGKRMIVVAPVPTVFSEYAALLQA